MNTPSSTLHPVLQNLEILGIVPVVVIDDPRKAGALARALIDGGLPCAEITFRTAAARDAIATMRDAYPSMLVGAGTVLTTQQAEVALEAGATFIVAPGINPEVVSFCTERGVPMTPGVMTPTDIETGLRLGLNVMKFFPAEAAGGLRFLKAVAAPYKSVRFVPTGGIDRSNFLSYLNFPSTLAVGGSWMVKAETIREDRFDLVTQEVQMAITTMLGLRIEPGSTHDASTEAALDELGSILPLVHGTRQQEKNEPHAAEGKVRLSTPFFHRVLGRLRNAGIGFSQPNPEVPQAELDIAPQGRTIELVQRQAEK